MNIDEKAIPAGDERLAGSLMNVVLELQKNRRRGISPPAGSPQEGAKVLSAINEQKQDVETKDAARTPGALPQEGSEERGRQRNVGQREEEGRLGQGPEVQEPNQRQQMKRQMM